LSIDVQLFLEKVPVMTGKPGWHTDPKLWPQDRSLKVLRDWCSFELHTVVVDVGDSPLEDDG
jgi:hypothetical protein